MRLHPHLLVNPSSRRMHMGSNQPKNLRKIGQCTVYKGEMAQESHTIEIMAHILVSFPLIGILFPFQSLASLLCWLILWTMVELL